MAKPIKITPECIEELLNDFKESLSGSKLSDGKINYTKTFGFIKRNATIFFTGDAWDKMQALVSGFDKEVAWHGIAHRGDEGTDDYYITDILVYPQEVSGASVNTDQVKYQTWLMGHDDDVFNGIRMQGHSHVNMGVTPSGVDTSLYERILEQLDDSMFYIFLIYNKRGDKTVKIYDIGKNVLFETSDVTVKVLDGVEERTKNVNFMEAIDGLNDEETKAVVNFLYEFRKKKILDGFVKEAKMLVKDRPAFPVTQSYGSGYGQNKGTYPYNIDTKKQEQKQAPKETEQQGKQRKGKREWSSTPSAPGVAVDKHNSYDSNTYGAYPDYDDDDYWTSPYKPFGYG